MPNFIYPISIVSHKLATMTYTKITYLIYRLFSDVVSNSVIT